MSGDKPQEHELLRWSLLQARVCSSRSWDEALEWLRRTNPAGTEHNWQKDERPEVAPVPCANGGGRTHYVFEC